MAVVIATLLELYTIDSVNAVPQVKAFAKEWKKAHSSFDPDVCYLGTQVKEHLGNARTISGMTLIVDEKLRPDQIRIGKGA